MKSMVLKNNESRLRIWTENLLLPGETALVDSAIKELCMFYSISEDEALSLCRCGVADSKKEWEGKRRDEKSQTIDFYNNSKSYIFEHMWWHTLSMNDEPLMNVDALKIAVKNKVVSYLDFGCGVGTNGILFPKHGINTTLADVSSTMLTFARWRLSIRNLEAEFLDLKRIRADSTTRQSFFT